MAPAALEEQHARDATVEAPAHETLVDAAELEQVDAATAEEDADAEVDAEDEGRMSWWRHSGMRSRMRVAPSTNSLSARPFAECAEEHTPAPYWSSCAPTNSLALSTPLAASAFASHAGTPTRGELPSKPARHRTRACILCVIDILAATPNALRVW